ncbi:MAG TPA: RAMP superfamily CRISPR-associated protein [Thermoanaerobaculia bacterium]|jgi:CRISPR/Cas system CSM-associated protein Csm3 (group 7 of RAMP superfamily)|nr:RAMP superfamily CRISPR-associated protein [Thermoanaerobaculia bacterium]
MFSQQLNQIRIDLSLTPKAPLLIRSGRKGSADPTRPELECVRTAWGGRPSVYIPGSSLKGVMRSHAERLLLSEEVKITPTLPAANGGFDNSTPGAIAYAGSSPLGRTFGNLSLKGHVAVSDHLPGAHAETNEERERLTDLANAVEQRNGVAIDRLLGSAAGKALFDQELVVQGRFDGRIVLRNVQLYQLALLLLVLRDLDEGYVQLGSGTTRGNGWVGAQVREIVIETRLGKSKAGTLRGVGALLAEAREYDLFDRDEMVLPSEIPSKKHLVWDQVKVGPGQVDALAQNLIDGPWTAFLSRAKGQTWRA